MGVHPAKDTGSRDMVADGQTHCEGVDEMSDETASPKTKVVVMTHAHNDNLSILCANSTLYSIYIDRERGTAKLECYPQYLYFESIEEARDIRDMLNALLEVNPVIKPNVPRFSSAPFARKGDTK